MSEKLKPCPFCGGEAEFCIEEHAWPPAMVRCSKCGIATQWEVLAIEAAEKWNARWDYYGDVIECYECAIGGKEAAQRCVEENIKAQGYVKERTCTMERDADGEWRCLACGETLSSWCDSWAPDYCPNCGAKVVEE